jgi:histone deacetylase complex regulatory component SIN3
LIDFENKFLFPVKLAQRVVTRQGELLQVMSCASSLQRMLALHGEIIGSEPNPLAQRAKARQSEVHQSEEPSCGEFTQNLPCFTKIHISLCKIP